MNYEELQTVLLETEAILNNRLLTHYFYEDLEDCLSPNHMLFERSLKFDPDQRGINHKSLIINQCHKSFLR